MLRYLRERAPEGAIIDALIVTHPHDDHYPGALGPRTPSPVTWDSAVAFSSPAC